MKNKYSYLLFSILLMATSVKAQNQQLTISVNEQSNLWADAGNNGMNSTFFYDMWIDNSLPLWVDVQPGAYTNNSNGNTPHRPHPDSMWVDVLVEGQSLWVDTTVGGYSLWVDAGVNGQIAYNGANNLWVDAQVGHMLVDIPIGNQYFVDSWIQGIRNYFNNNGGRIFIETTDNLPTPWQVNVSDNWIHLTGDNHRTGADFIDLVFDDNLTGLHRTGTIVINDQFSQHVINVQQPPVHIVADVQPGIDTLFMPAGGGADMVPVITNANQEKVWMAKIAGAGFLDTDKFFIGRGSKSVLVQALPNNTNSTKYGYMTLFDGDDYKFVVLHQEAGQTSNARTAVETQETKALTGQPSVAIYPNPAKEKLTIRGLADQQLTIYDVSGRLVTQIYLDSNKEDIDISSFKNGVFIASINSGSDSRQFRFVKE